MDPSATLPEKTALTRTFVFWFSFFKQSLGKGPATGLKYEDNINQICSFNTIEDFWGYYQHMVRPEQLPVGCDFFLFQQGIKPMWEDAANDNGGRFLLKVFLFYLFFGNLIFILNQSQKFS